MNNIQKLHDEAMTLAESAFVAKIEGDLERSEQLLRQAYEKETQAAKMVPDEPSAEPTRSVLHRSAASLALDCNDYREAERLIASGLSGNPPEDIAEELRELFEKLNFRRHLDLRGIILGPEELQMSIAGRAISPGIAPSEEFIMRIEDARKMICRTVERLMGMPYREGGAISRLVRDYGLFVSVPRVSSFAVSLRVSGPKQPPFPGLEKEFKFVHSAQIIDEIMYCLDYFNRSDEILLREKIPQEAYYRNFVGIVKNIAPDGNEVKLVGFTTVRDGKERRVQMTKTRDELRLGAEVLLETAAGIEEEMTTIIGRLLFADATRSTKQTIRIIDETGRSHGIIVPEGMMSDIVKPLWEERVKVTGPYRQRAIQLQDITRAPAD